VAGMVECRAKQWVGRSSRTGGGRKHANRQRVWVGRHGACSCGGVAIVGWAGRVGSGTLRHRIGGRCKHQSSEWQERWR
jgi:hypothetical protein